jgi:hypothetical protein
MTKQELDKLREDVMKKFGAYLKAEEELAEQGIPGGFTDQNFYYRVAEAKREYNEAETKWRESFYLYLFEISQQQQ